LSYIKKLLTCTPETLETNSETSTEALDIHHWKHWYRL